MTLIRQLLKTKERPVEMGYTVTHTDVKSRVGSFTETSKIQPRKENPTLCLPDLLLTSLLQNTRMHPA